MLKPVFESRITRDRVLMSVPQLEVHDPQTAPERLREIAYLHPELRAAIAQHPNAYPALREWIAGRAEEPRAASRDASPEPVGTAPKRSTRFWTRTRVIVSGTIALVGTVASVISIVPILTRDATNFSHLRIAAEQTTGEATEWVLPPESLGLDFPAGDACGAEQVDWLKEHAEPLQRRIVITARNTAGEGAMLALTQFRSTAEGSQERGPVGVRLVCDPRGRLPEQIFYGKLLADDPEASALQVKLEPGDPAKATPDVPVTFNLAPGETGKIPLEFFSRNPVSGAVQVSVLSRDEERTIEIEGSEFEMPALLYGGEMYLFTTADGLQCQRVETGTLSPCTMDELRREQATART